MKAIGGGFHAVPCLLQGLKHAAHVLKKQCSGMSKSRAPRGAGEKHHTQIFFQFLDGARQRRLLDVQTLGRAGKVELFSDR